MKAQKKIGIFFLRKSKRTCWKIGISCRIEGYQEPCNRGNHSEFTTTRKRDFRCKLFSWMCCACLSLRWSLRWSSWTMRSKFFSLIFMAKDDVTDNAEAPGKYAECDQHSKQSQKGKDRCNASKD